MIDTDFCNRQQISLPIQVMFKDAHIKEGDIIRVMQHSAFMFKHDGRWEFMGYKPSPNQKPHLVLTNPVSTDYGSPGRNFIKFDVLDLETGNTDKIVLATIDMIEVAG